MQNQFSKESIAIKFKKRRYAKLCLQLWFENGWYFCNITKPGWFLKRNVQKERPKRPERTS